MNNEKDNDDNVQKDPAYGGEVETGPGASQPRWLRWFFLALYAFAIFYMLRYAGDRWIIRIFAFALTVWAIYSFRDLFKTRSE